MNKTNSLFGILTDETTSIGVDCRKANGYKIAALLFVDGTTKFELRVLIAACIYEGAQRWRMIRLYTDPPLQWVLGALYDSDVLNQAVSNMDLQGRRWFADFDLYTMQRVPELWYRFYQWREDVQEAGLKNPLTAGSTLRFEPHGFERHSGLQRSPYPFFPIPSDTVAIIKGGRPSRTRNRTLDNVLGSCEEVSLTIVEVKRAAPGQFSQVFFGRVEGCDEVVCVKLFDERYFPIPEVDDFESISGPPQTRLGSLNYSGDLAMREEAVYDRLKDLQGGLLPFCYGFHLVCISLHYRLCSTVSTSRLVYLTRWMAMLRSDSGKNTWLILGRIIRHVFYRDSNVAGKDLTIEPRTYFYDLTGFTGQTN